MRWLPSPETIREPSLVLGSIYSPTMLHSGVPWPVDDGKLSRFPYIFPSPSRSEPRCVARELEQQETPDARGQIWTRFDSYGLHMKIHLAISQDHLYSGHQGLFCRAGGRQRSTPDVASERALHWTRRCSLNPAGHALSLAVHRTSFPFRRGRRVYPASQLCQIDSFLKRRTADKKTALALSICGCCIPKYPGSSSVQLVPGSHPPRPVRAVLSRPSQLHHHSPVTRTPVADKL